MKKYSLFTCIYKKYVVKYMAKTNAEEPSSMGRSQSREQAFIFTFEKMFNPELTYEDMTALATESALFSPDDFTGSLYRLTEQHTAEADAEIGKYLKKWRLERLPKVSLAILRLSVCEILFSGDVPPGVVANEAVNLAKKYATKEDASFINGVLGSLIRARTPQEQPADKPETDDQ